MQKFEQRGDLEIMCRKQVVLVPRSERDNELTRCGQLGVCVSAGELDPSPSEGQHVH